MTELQLELTRLLGKKDLSFGCRLLNKYHGYFEYFVKFQWDGWNIRLSDCSLHNIEHFEIIGHPATLSDFHRWLDEREDTCGNSRFGWRQSRESILVWIDLEPTSIQYDSSKDLLDQDESTLKAIISLIQSYERN